MSLFSYQKKDTRPVKGFGRKIPLLRPKDSADVSLKSTSNLVIAIDFGTTFTGVAYAHSNVGATGPAPPSLYPNRVAENINVIKTWPAQNRQYAEKTPSLIAYNTVPPTWGGCVRAKHDKKFSNFKLALEPKVKNHYGAGGGELTLGANSDLDKDLTDVTADYLSCVHKFVNEVYLPNQFGAEFLKNQQKLYFITVPAIWSDLAKALTRQAAARAGIPDDRLFLVTEPEAAALFCATTCEEVDLRDGDRFLVCDAGGGTVVCRVWNHAKIKDLIAYQIVTRVPFQIKECTVGTGAACGAFRLDEGFKEILRRKLGGYAESLLKPRTLEEAVNHFENAIKRQYNPYLQDCEDEYEIPLAGAPDIPPIDLEAGYLRFTRLEPGIMSITKHGREEIREIFDPVFSQILDLIQAQIAAAKTNSHSNLKVKRHMNMLIF